LTLLARRTNLASVSLPLRRCATLLLAGLSFIGLSAQPVPAQAVAGVGDDAIPIPRGGTRLTISGLWNDYQSVFDAAGNKRPLLAPYATSAAGTSLFPQFAGAEQQIRALTRQSGFQLSLGALDALGEVRQSAAPISLEYGLTKRLSIRVVVPYVESRDINRLILNAEGTGANVGINPALAANGAAARSANGALTSQIEQARTALRAELTRCATSTATNCTVIRANPAGAEALLDRAATSRASLIALYGDAQRAGSPLVPLTGSAQQTAIVETIRALRTDFAAFGITNIADNAAPAAATTILGPAGIRRIATDSALGGRYREIGNTRRAGIGDIDLTATALLFDSFGADQARRLTAATRGVRSTLTGGWRFGTAGADRTEDAFDVPIGEGASAILARSTTDLILSRSLWVSATIRGVQPLSDQLYLPVAQPDSLRLAPADRFAMTRSLGRRLDLEIAPRLAIGQFFGISGAYLHRSWDADRYTPVARATEDARTSPASGSTTPSRTMRAASVGVTFSTLSGFVRGKSRLPLEVLYTHTEALGASAAGVPAVSTDRLELRIYTGFPRR